MPNNYEEYFAALLSFIQKRELLYLLITDRIGDIKVTVELPRRSWKRVMRRRLRKMMRNQLPRLLLRRKDHLMKKIVRRMIQLLL